MAINHPKTRCLSPLLEFSSFVPHLTRHDDFCVLPRLQPFPGQGSRSWVRMASLTALGMALGKPLLNPQHCSSLQRCPLPFSTKTSISHSGWKLFNSSGPFSTRSLFVVGLSNLPLTWLKIIAELCVPFMLCPSSSQIQALFSPTKPSESQTIASVCRLKSVISWKHSPD